MKKYVFLIVVITTVFSSDLFAQTFSKRYESLPDISQKSGLGVIERANEYIFIDEAGTLSKVDNSGTPLWSIQTSAAGDFGSLLASPGGLCILGDGNILKAGNIDFNLNPSHPLVNFSLIGWAKVQNTSTPTYLLRKWFNQNYNLAQGIPLSGYVKDISSTSDGGGIIAVDYSLPTYPPQGNLHPMFIKVDVNANLQWIKSMSAMLMGNSAEINVVEQCNDGEYICGGNELHPITGNGNSAWVSKIDLITGNTSWLKNFNYHPLYGTCPLKVTDVIELANGNFAVTLNDVCEGGQLLILNNQGLTIYYKKYLLQNYSTDVIYFNSIEEGDNGKLLITGSNISNENNLVFLNINQNDGSINNAWQYFETFNNTRNNTLLSQDNFLIVSSASTENQPSGGYTKNLIKMDQNGNVDEVCKIPVFLTVSDVENISFEDFNFPPGIYDENAQVLGFSSTPQNNLTEFETDCCELAIELTDFDVKCGPPYYLEGPDNYLSYYWNTGETTQEIEIKPGNTYTLTVVDANGCVGTATYTFDLPLFDEYEIIAPESKCCTDQTYSVSANFNGSYSWGIIPSSDGTVNPINGQSTQIIWNNLTTNSIVYVTMKTENGCEVTLEYLVEGCCPNTASDPAINTNYCNSSITTLSSLGLGSSISTSNHIYINDDLLIDQNFSFNSCPFIFIEQNKKIIVQPGVQFSIINSTLTAKCEYMWDGIYISDPNNALIISGSRIEQAKNALVSDNGGAYTIQNTAFLNDYKGIVVNATNTPHTGTVTGSTFNSITGALLSPYNQPTTRMQTGIELIQVNQITVGDPLAQNLFNNTDYGIYDTESDLISLNNHFTNLALTSAACTVCDCPIGTGICATGTKINPIDVTVGGSTSDANTFNKVNHAIDVHGGASLTANYNIIDQTETGIRFSGNAFGSADINYNNIKKFKIGILCSNNLFTQHTIIFNDLNTGFSGSPSAVSNVGIYLFNNFQQLTNANIHNNTIKKTRNGIFLRNARGIQPWPVSFLRVEDNVINFGAVPNNTAQFHYGIRLEETDNAYINHNFVDKANGNNPNATVVPKLRGISLLNSRGNTVTKNEITRMGTGIRAFGSCANSTLACNVLFRNFHGFVFEGPADISDQLPGQIPTGNTWTMLVTPGASDININLNVPIDWFYPQNGYNPSWIGAISSFNNISGPTSTTFTEICSQFQIQAPIDDRESRLGKIVRNEKNFVTNSNEFNLNDKIFANRFLNENPSYLSLGTNDDTTYQNFMNSCNANCIGKFNKVHEYIEQNDLTNASVENASITDNITWEYNLKRVNEIYLNYLNSDSIINSDSIELNDIAWQNILDGGPGVIMARSILNLDIEDVSDGTTRNLLDKEVGYENILVNKIEAFPNPSNGEITLSSSTSMKNLDIIIQDVTGKTVYNSIIISEENYFLIKLDLPPGLYMLIVKNKDEWVDNLKIVIE